MAFTAVLRRAATTAARSLRHHQTALCHHPSLRRLPAAPFAVPTARAFASKASHDSGLLRVIDEEIKCAVESDDHDRVEEIPRGFPFQIQDDEGKNVIILTRDFNGEKIEVVVSMPSLVTGEDPPEHDKNDDDDDDGEGADQEEPSQSSFPLIVTVSKGEGPRLEFSCTAYPDDVVIDSMSVSENEESDDEALVYQGPDFNDLDENLQKAFHKYLEIRGISAMTTNFLHEYMINKDSREYLIWLRNLKQFVEK